MSKITIKHNMEETSQNWQLGDIILTKFGSLWKIYEDSHTGLFYLIEFNSNVFSSRDGWDSIEEMQCELGDESDLIVDIEIKTQFK